MSRLILWFTLLSAALSAPAQALTLYGVGEGLFAFQAELRLLLPPSLQAAVNAPVTIRFEALDDTQDLAASVCPGPEAKRSPKLGTFRTKRTGLFWGEKSYELVLHERFREAIAAGPRAAAKIPCGHKDLYRLALATAVHEITHIYDFLGLPQEPGETEAREACARLTSSDDRGSAEFEQLKCAYYAGIQRTVSDRLPFQLLAGWALSNSNNKNKLALRSPDPYEYTNSTESFAVNMEHFLLDPEFQCRRPALYGFYADHFGVRPHAGACDVNWQTRMSFTLRPISLDPDKVYAIHNLLAGRGEAMMSKWGHSMFRLITCAPHRKTVGPECLQDVSHHIVVSYRANISGITIDNIAGLTGKYPSQLFLLPMTEIIGEYSMGEFRDLYSLPIKMSEREKRRFLQIALETNWAYQGKYTFLSNNCATESLHHLQAALDNMEFKRYYAAFDKPVDLQDAFLEFGLIDDKLLQAKNARDRYFFPGFYRLVNQSYATLRGFKGFPAQLDLEELISLSGEERFELYTRLKAKNPGDTRKIAVQFLYIEMRTREKVRENLKQELSKLLAQAREKPESMDKELLAALEEIAQISYSLSPWNRANPGYGVPLQGEAVTDEALVPVAEKLNALKAKATRLSKGMAEILFRDFEKISQNIERFVNDTK